MTYPTLYPPESIYNRLRRLGWVEFGKHHHLRFFRKRDWIAEVPNSIKYQIKYRRIR